MEKEKVPLIGLAPRRETYVYFLRSFLKTRRDWLSRRLLRQPGSLLIPIMGQELWTQAPAPYRLIRWILRSQASLSGLKQRSLRITLAGLLVRGQRDVYDATLFAKSSTEVYNILPAQAFQLLAAH